MLFPRCLPAAVLGLFFSPLFAQSPISPAPSPSPGLPLSPPPAGDSLHSHAPPSSPKPGSPQITYNSVYVDGPYIAMTFDDGPHGSLTPKLLDLLAARKIKATFFVVGKCVAEYPAIVTRAAREGHEIANHSWSHANLGKMSDEGVRRELQKTDDAIKAAIGARPKMFRPPYGSITARQKSWIHDDFGYKTIIWDVDPLDWKRPGPSVVTSRIVSNTGPGSIILAHDIHAPTIDAMPQTFAQLQEKGFKFVTVSELLGMAKPAPPKPVSTATPVARATAPAPRSPSPAAQRP